MLSLTLALTKRSDTLLAIFNTRSVHAIAVDNVSRNNNNNFQTIRYNDSQRTERFLCWILANCW